MTAKFMIDVLVLRSTALINCPSTFSNGVQMFVNLPLLTTDRLFGRGIANANRFFQPADCSSARRPNYAVK